MRKILTNMLVVLTLFGVGAGSWYLTAKEPWKEAEIILTTLDGTETTTTNTPGGTTIQVDDAATIRKPTEIGSMLNDANMFLPTIHINSLNASRITTYMLVAWYDAQRSVGEPGIISQTPGGTSSEAALSVAGQILAALTYSDSIQQDIDRWAIPLTPEYQQIVKDILDRANADGYDKAGGVDRPVYTSPDSWTVGTNNTYLMELEPGWGTLQPIALNIDACPVAPPTLEEEPVRSETIAAVGTSVQSLDLEVISTVLLNSSTTNPITAGGILFKSVSGLTAKATPIQIRQAVYDAVLIYDAIIATWRTKWQYGVASPLDMYNTTAEAIPTIVSTAPSYPSWPAVLVGAVQHYTKILYGRVGDWVGNPDIDPYKIFRSGDVIVNTRIFNWTADVTAGTTLGQCLAELAAAGAQQNG